MGIYLKLTSNAPSASGVVLLNGTTDTGYVRVSGGDWGMVDSQPLFSSSIDTEGGAAVGQNVPNRTISLPLCISGASASATQTLFTTLAATVSECQRFGGKLRFRPSNASYGVTFEVEHVKVVGDHWPKLAELGAAIMVELSVTCKPYANTDPIAWVDDFSTNRFTTAGQFNDAGSDYTAANGSLTNIPISGGKVTASSGLTTQYRVIQTGNVNTYTDHIAWIEFTVGSTISGFECGVILKYVDANNYVRVYVSDDGVDSKLYIQYVVGGTPTGGGSVITRIEAGATYYIRAGISYNQMLQWEVSKTKHTPTSTSSVSDFGTSALRTAFGPSVSGRVGFLFTPQHASATVNTFAVENIIGVASSSGPKTFRVNGSIPGDVGAPTSIGASLLTSTHKSFVAGWTPTIPPHNVVQNYGFETSVLGWSTSAVTGLHSAATSITRVTTASKVYEGTAAAEVVCPATSGAGVSYKIFRSWVFGQTYTAKFRAISTGGSTTPLCIKLGNPGSGTVETSASINLSSSWQEYEVTWTYTSGASDRAVYVAAAITAATATTFQIDNVRVYEGASGDEPAYRIGGAAPFGVLYCADTDRDNMGSFFSVAADASSLSGTVLEGTGAPGANAYAEWWIHPWAMTPDDGSRRGQCLVDVYLHARLASTQTSGTVVLSVLHDTDNYAAERFSFQYGSTGKALALPSSGTCNRCYFVGTIPLMVDRDNPEAIKLRLEYTASGGASGVFKLDYLHLVPTLRSASTVTGVADTGSTRFISSVGYEKIVRSDLSGAIRQWESLPATPDFGLVGSNIVLPPGRNDITFDTATYVIDRPESDANTDSTLAGWFTVVPQPRRLMVGQ